MSIYIEIRLSGHNIYHSLNIPNIDFQPLPLQSTLVSLL